MLHAQVIDDVAISRAGREAAACDGVRCASMCDPRHRIAQQFHHLFGEILRRVGEANGATQKMADTLGRNSRCNNCFAVGESLDQLDLETGADPQW